MIIFVLLNKTNNMKSLKKITLIFLLCFLVITNLSNTNLSNTKKTNSKEKNYIVGADLSHYQGNIKWTKKDKELFTFIYIKSTEGGNFKDSRFQRNYNGIKNVGIFVGAYHVYNPKVSGKKQALNFINTVPKGSNDLPPAVDLHLVCYKTKSDVKKFRTQLKIFLNMIKDHYGKEVVFYVSNNQYDKYLNGYFKNQVWTWHYTNKTEPKNFGNLKCKMWQYGIAGKSNKKYKKYTNKFGLDLDYFVGSKKEFLKFIKP